MIKLSIITINFNNKLGLQKTIESVINQTSKEFEFIVIDGNSIDGSKELISHNQSNFTYSVSESDTGIYQAMNKGILKASGEYLLFLNSGDCFNNKEVVSLLSNQLNDNDVISGDINICQDNKWKIVKSQDAITIDYFLSISLFHQATFIKKELFIKRGLYDESFKLCGDYEFFIRTLIKQNATYKHIPVLISDFYADGMSNDKNYNEINIKEREIAWRKHFSKLVYSHFETSKKIRNSKEIKWGKRFFRFFPFAKSIDKLLSKIWY